MTFRRAILVLTLALFGFGAQATDVPVARRTPIARPSEKFVKAQRPIANTYVIKLTDYAEQEGMDAVLAVLLERYPMIVTATWEHALFGFSAQMQERVARALSTDALVDWVEEDQGAEAMGGTQSNPSWGLDRIDQRSPIRDSLYNYPVGASGVHIYIIDSGIRVDHADFGGRASLDFTAINDGNGANDCWGHGTEVASVAGGATYGVAKKARLHSVRVLDCNGGGSAATIVAGLDWIVANGKKPAVANVGAIFLGGSLLVDAAAQRLIDAGIPVVVPAGNESRDACMESPGRVGGAITVGGSAPTEYMYFVSDFGTCVDVFAPGDYVDVATKTSSTSHDVVSGTSVASPHVAGAAAMFIAANPNASPYDVATALVANSTQSALLGLPPATANRLLYMGFIPACSGSLEMCKGACVDLLSSMPNCGECGKACTGSGLKCFDGLGGWYYAGVTCSAGRCVSRSCEE